MTFATHHRRGGSGFLVPAPRTHTLTSANNAGGSAWTIPRAYSHGGTTVLGWVDGSGNIEVATFDETSEVLSAVTTVHASFQVDAHNSPALLRRSSDGRVLCVYSRHNDTPINLRISTNPDDVTAWGSATNLDSQLGGTRYTDYQIHQLADGTIWLIYRDEPSAGTDSRWCYSTSTDGGATWSAQTILYRVASQRSYVISWATSTRIHFIATNGGSTGGGYSGFTALFHWYYEGGAWYESDGTSMGAPPFSYTNATEAYVGTQNVFMANIAIDGDGYPRVLAEDKIAGSSYYIALRWTGSAWASVNVAYAGAGYQYNAGGAYQAYGGIVDVTDPNTLWLLRAPSGQSELWRYRSSDEGATWTGQQVTSGSSGLQITPVPVKDGSDALRVYWQSGSWTHYTTWSMGQRGVGTRT